jgi:hypothetical protein
MLLNWDVPLPARREQAGLWSFCSKQTHCGEKRSEADAVVQRILPALFHKLFGDPATNPEGWPRVRLETLITDTRNGLYKNADCYGRGTQILKIFNILDGQLNLSRSGSRRIERIRIGYLSTGGWRHPHKSREYAGLVGKCAVISKPIGESVFENKNTRIRIDCEIAEARLCCTLFEEYPSAGGPLSKGRSTPRNGNNQQPRCP